MAGKSRLDFVLIAAQVKFERHACQSCGLQYAGNNRIASEVAAHDVNSYDQGLHNAAGRLFCRRDDLDTGVISAIFTDTVRRFGLFAVRTERGFARVQGQM